jgi:hypothetical protein
LSYDDSLKFIIRPVDDEYVMIHYYLDDIAFQAQALTGNQNGDTVVPAGANGSDSQKFKIINVSKGYFKIIAKSSGKCLTSTYSGSRLDQIKQKDCNDTDEQLWKISNVDKSYTPEYNRNSYGTLYRMNWFVQVRTKRGQMCVTVDQGEGQIPRIDVCDPKNTSQKIKLERSRNLVVFNPYGQNPERSLVPDNNDANEASYLIAKNKKEAEKNSEMM